MFAEQTDSSIHVIKLLCCHPTEQHSSKKHNSLLRSAVPNIHAQKTIIVCWILCSRTFRRDNQKKFHVSVCMCEKCPRTRYRAACMCTSIVSVCSARLGPYIEGLNAACTSIILHPREWRTEEKQPDRLSQRVRLPVYVYEYEREKESERDVWMVNERAR